MDVPKLRQAFSEGTLQGRVRCLGEGVYDKIVATWDWPRVASDPKPQTPEP